jgi:hypothetical protein
MFLASWRFGIDPMSITRRALLGSATALPFLKPGKAEARFLNGSIITAPATQSLQTLPVGAGGQFASFSIADDETHIQHTDTYGGYICAWPRLWRSVCRPAQSAT